MSTTATTTTPPQGPPPQDLPVSDLDQCFNLAAALAELVLMIDAGKGWPAITQQIGADVCLSDARLALASFHAWCEREL